MGQPVPVVEVVSEDAVVFADPDGNLELGT